MDFLKPKQTGIRDPLSNAQTNGRIMNPPRMAQLGGLSSTKKRGAMTKNALTIRKPGGSAS